MKNATQVVVASASGRRRWLSILGWSALLLAMFATRWVSIFTESINWDEFALLERSERTLRLGTVVGGGRPGLAAILLTSVVRDCVDAITTAVRARLLWQLFTLAYLGGAFFLVRNWFRFSRRPEPGVFEGLSAAALLGLLPAFLTWSIQVRTDQAALALAVWGGACMLTERRFLAVIGGMLFGLSLLCTQKGLYPIALCGLLWLLAVLARIGNTEARARAREIRSRSEQAILGALSAAATIVCYMYFVPNAADLADVGAVTHAWGEMRKAQANVGFSVYRNEIGRALLHDALLVGLIIATLAAIHGRRRQDFHLLLTSWAVLLLGLVVVLVHGSGYQYFLMTVGLFPAVSLGMAAGHLARPLGRHRPLVIGSAFLALVLGSVPVTIELLDGSQASQRDTMNWIGAGELRSRQGYQVDGALICRGEQDQMPAMSHKLNMRDLSTQEAESFVQDLRRRQVAFFIDADLLGRFPKDVIAFCEEHYRWYYGAVWVAGSEVRPELHGQEIDVFVPGPYRWIPSAQNHDASLELDGRVMPAGDKIELSVGNYTLAVHPAGATGALVLALSSTPGEVKYPFMDPRQRERLVGAH